MLKYVHALLCTTQCDSVKEQSCACGAGIFFVYDQRSGWTWPLDKDAVCGPMAVWCPPAWPVGGVNVWGIIFIHTLPQFILVNSRVSQAVWTPNVITNARWRFPGLKLHDVDASVTGEGVYEVHRGCGAMLKCSQDMTSQEPSVKPWVNWIFFSPKLLLLTYLWDIKFNNTLKPLATLTLIEKRMFVLNSRSHQGFILIRLLRCCHYQCVFMKKKSVF